MFTTARAGVFDGDHRWRDLESPIGPRHRGARGATGLATAPMAADGSAAAAPVRPDLTVLRADRNVAALCDAAPKFLVA